MIEIDYYLNDGANWQAQAVLAYIRAHYFEATDMAYKNGSSKAKVRVGRFENCREQGYVFSIIYDYTKQKNFCVYEHRNSDNICVLVNNTFTINTPTIDEMWEGKKDKWDYDKSFEFGKVVECGDWIIDEMAEFVASCMDEEKENQESE